MLTGTLKNKVDRIWDAFWSGGISNPLTVVEQVTYLLFIKRLDDIHTQREAEANFSNSEIKNPVFGSDQQHLRWSRFKDDDPEEKFELFQKEKGPFQFMKRMGAAEETPFAEYMKDAVFIIPNAELLDMAISMLDALPMESRDMKGDLYEYLLSKLTTAGKNGQFRTPRHIIRMMVHMMAPRPDDIICDPAAGTAGFLVAAGDYLRNYHEKLFYDDEQAKHFNNKMFHGYEFDATMIRIAAMNLMLHGIENPELKKKDALSKVNSTAMDEYTLILANPPFKGSLNYDNVDEKLLNLVKTKKTELLFLALMLRLLKTGGRASVIVPDGVLFGSSNAHKALRQEIIEKQQLQAVISMPSGVFKPYAGVSTAVLVFTKTNSGGTDKVWFYDMQADGHSLDDKRTEYLTDEEWEKVFDQPCEIADKYLGKCDIADILCRWKNLEGEAGRKRTNRSFLVPFEEIKKNDWNLSINQYKELVYEEVEYDSPKEIISGKNGEKGIRQLTEERFKLLNELEEML